MLLGINSISFKHNYKTLLSNQYKHKDVLSFNKISIIHSHKDVIKF